MSLLQPGKRIHEICDPLNESLLRLFFRARDEKQLTRNSELTVHPASGTATIPKTLAPAFVETIADFFIRNTMHESLISEIHARL